jgi:molybdate/tungstate transport system substrate-binding protein
MTRILPGTIGLILALAGATGCGKIEPVKEKLVIFHAGSLSVPIKELGRLFMKKHPGIVVEAEAAGSRDSARKICDLKRPCDVFASADYKVVENLLMPEYTDFNIRFAFNEMVLAYAERSRFGGEVGPDNWYEVLLREGVTFGRSDPDRDPCGYRTEMVFQLAERHYGIERLAERLRSKHGRKYIRPKETDLLALLEAGELDYLFIYRSVASQHGLSMVLLPDEVNLKSPAHASLYATASVKVTGKKPGETVTRSGAPMEYSVTIPRDAPNRKAAEDFVALLLSPEGREIMESNGQPFRRPPKVDGAGELPAVLRRSLTP